MVIDILLLVFLILFVFIGIKNGFVRSLLGIVAVIIAAILAAWFSDLVAQSVYDGFLNDTIEPAINAQLPNMNSAQITMDDTRTIIFFIPKVLMEKVASTGTAVSMIDLQIGSFTFETAIALVKVTGTVAKPIADALLKVLSFAINFLIINLVLQIIVIAISKFFDLPVLKTLNRTLGGIAGAIKGVFVVAVLAILLDASAAIVTNVDFVEAVNSSKIINMIVSTDVFLQLISA